MPIEAMDVVDLSAARALPRVAPTLARALGTLYTRCAALTLPLRETPLQLRWRFRTDEPAGLARYAFRIGSHGGHVGLDALALGVLWNERRGDLLPRDLRYILLADALHPLADALEKATRLHFEWTPPEADGTLVCDPQRAAFFDVQPAAGGGGFGGYLQLDDDAALGALLGLLALPPRSPSPLLDSLRVPLPFSLGTTPMRLREMRSIRPGDIVSIEQWAAAGSALVVRAELGAAQRLVGLAEGARITLQSTKDTPMNRDPAAPLAPTDAPDSANLPLDRLDALEVTLRFEVGELTISLGELKAIRAGHVFELAQPLNRSPVRILAHGNVLGKGYLVAVGDRLGVRVSEFAPGDA